MAGMDDAWIRVNRAKANYEALDRAIKAFGKDHPDAQTAVTEEGDDGQFRVIARIKERPPRDWALAAGDILVDLRSALDYAVYALAIKGSRQPVPPHPERLEFPVTKDVRNWPDTAARKLANIPPKAIAVIKAQQPFDPKHGGVDKAPLMALEELVGINKHRFIYVGWTRLDTTKLAITMLNAKPVDFVAYHLPGELEDRTVLASYRVERSAPDGYVKIDPQITTFVVIEPSAKGWIRLDDFLPKIGGYVESVVRSLEPFA